MSRIGRMPITVPEGLAVEIKQGEVTVTGPKGILQRRFHHDMSINLNNNMLTVTRPSDSKIHRSLHGLTRTLLANMVQGVDKGFEKTLEVVGVGYRVEKSGVNVLIRAGFTHQMTVSPLPGISLAVEGSNRIKVSGIDKELVGEMAAEIRSMRPPDEYKGKGIRYVGEQVHLKPGKTGKSLGKKT